MAAAKEEVLKTSHPTNALAPPGLEDALITAGLDSIRISIDGITQEAYEQYRVGGQLGSVWANLRRFADAKQRHGATAFEIEAQFIVNRFNEHQAEDFHSLAKESGADRVRLKTFNALMTGQEMAATGRAFLPADRRFSRYADYTALTHRDRYLLSQCEWPWERIVVNADGAIVPCSYDYNGRHRLGSFAAESEWDTDQRRVFRERLRNDPMSIDMAPSVL